MKKLIVTTLAAYSVSLSFSAFALCSKGETELPNQVQLQGYTQPAILNGFGARTKLVWDVYYTALYLPQLTTDSSEALSMPGPIRITLTFAHDVPAEKLVEGWQDGFNHNNSEAELAGLKDRLESSYSYFTDMKVGDSIHIDRHPSEGSQLWINGEHKLSIPGDDYFKAVMKIWLGKEPAQNQLKECLLGAGLS